MRVIKSGDNELRTFTCSKELNKYVPNIIVKDMLGCYILFEGRRYIYLSNENDMNTVAHEIGHSVFRLGNKKASYFANLMYEYLISIRTAYDYGVKPVIVYIPVFNIYIEIKNVGLTEGFGLIYERIECELKRKGVKTDSEVMSYCLGYAIKEFLNKRNLKFG